MKANYPELVCSKPGFTCFAIHHRITEPTYVPARHPHLGVHNDRTIESNHFDFLAIRSRRRVADHILPPGVLDVLFQFHTERTVIPEAIDPAVNARRLKDEPGVGAEFGELRHVDLGHKKPLCFPAIGLRREAVEKAVSHRVKSQFYQCNEFRRTSDTSNGFSVRPKCQ